MNGWYFVGSLLPGLWVAFAAGSWLSGRTPGWLARSGFLAVAALVTALLAWTFQNLSAVVSGFIVALLLIAAALVASADDLIEDNAPPTPEIRAEILAYHTAAALHYPKDPFGKRSFDIIASSVGIVVTLPLWFLVAVLIWLEEPGPIFFTKNSVGLGGVTFRELKFRTMHYGAERHTGPVVATFEDPRALAVGRVFRRWHLDEMPELLNVLNGTMSLVGPRPLRALVVRNALDEVPGLPERHTVRPGIACIAQIEKCHVEPAERLSKDLIYINQMSVAFDIRLLVRAVVTTVLGKREPAPTSDVAVAPSRSSANAGQGPWSHT